ncbi:MAG: DUF167 domain-containing protein [Candidatus Aenigmatarchaeota archaeon]
MVIISVKIIPNSKKLEITKVDENNYRIKLNAPTIEGKANSRLIEVLSDHFNVKKSSIKIVSGSRSRNKRIEIR